MSNQLPAAHLTGSPSFPNSSPDYLPILSG